MEYVISKIDAAVDQLDWAIRLFLDHQAYVPAITLAGAAEEIIGSTLGDEAAFKVLTRRASTQFGLSPAVVTQAHLNKAKNWLKHWRNLKDDETVALELEKEAVQYIVRACTNLIAHDRSLPSEGPRFFAWLSSNRASAHGSKWRKYALAVMIAPLALYPAALLGLVAWWIFSSAPLQESSPIVGALFVATVGLIYAYPATLLFGLPVFLFLEKRRILNITTAALAGLAGPWLFLLVYPNTELRALAFFSYFSLWVAVVAWMIVCWWPQRRSNLLLNADARQERPRAG